jgi:hypothetical protein
VAGTLAGVALVAGSAVSPAWAAGASVSVSGVGGAAVANTDGPTSLKLSGRGFQSIQGGFGGIYVLFGSVSGNWRPSAGGTGGREYLYVPDVQAKNNAGREKFVAFPGSETAASANGGTIAADGSWSTTIEVPGPVFEVEDASGKTVAVDCRQVQCGVITIGAHAVVNANNETFTQVTFGAGGANQGADTGGATGEAGEANPAAAAVAGGVPTVGVDATTAVAGHGLAFTARGFAPGEQVTAVLDDGVVSVGPLTAGQFGEVASTIQLDPDLRVGSHTLTLTGAASGAAAEALVTVRRDPSLAEAAAEAAQGGARTGEERSLGAWEIAIVVAAIVFLLVLVGSLSGAAAARRARAARSGRPAARADRVPGAGRIRRRGRSRAGHGAPGQRPPVEPGKPQPAQAPQPVQNAQTAESAQPAQAAQTVEMAVAGLDTVTAPISSGEVL